MFLGCLAVASLGLLMVQPGIFAPQILSQQSFSASNMPQEGMLDRVSIVSQTRPYASHHLYPPTCYEKLTGNACFESEITNNLAYSIPPCQIGTQGTSQKSLGA